MIENNEEIPRECSINQKKKRKRGETMIEDYWKEIEEHNRKFSEIEDNWIKFWNDRIKLEENVQNKKKFQALDQSLLTQINQILMEKDRLVKRSQLKRFDENIVGSDLLKQNFGDDLPENSKKKSKSLDVSEYYPEIYDDSDFYQVKKFFFTFFFLQFFFFFFFFYHRNF